MGSRVFLARAIADGVRFIGNRPSRDFAMIVHLHAHGYV
jgi:hypothetical protein